VEDRDMLSDEEARLFAIEWLVRRLAVDQCLMSDDPTGAAFAIVKDARNIAKAFAAQETAGAPEVTVNALVLINATVDLAESVSEAVQTALSR
jgi:hypothetical protein